LTPVEPHDPRPIGAGHHRIKLAIALTSYEDRVYLSIEADDAYLAAEEIPPLLRSIEQSVIALARKIDRA
ncbi:hypothetical protein KDL01_41615, partial [Actinospica durhamensis]